ncbi:two-component sensor histidine kinase [Lysobacter oculi]|uniref:histidine kinase n=1 Tax=Solilutibacter oculi TaxID=2698682 RepID=A0A344J2W1_9GAMM|nr:HAMP domain-containing sensor histidine kinase [Lysobacter oculi]AXA83371.1 two-component sensor histidine kinase [Lysobacter oculi]
MTASNADEKPPGNRRMHRRRRRLRSRIIWSFFLLGLGLTLLLAYSTNWVRTRVEEDMVTDVMNRNIDEYAKRYYASGGKQIGLPVEQMYGRVVAKEKFESLRQEQPDWYRLGDGIHPIVGRNDDGSPFTYKLAVRKTPEQWFFLAYDMGESTRRSEKFERALYFTIPFFALVSLLLGWWSASKVMSPVTDLAQRLRRAGSSSDPEALAPHFADDEVGELAKTLDDYSDRLTDVVQRDREFNADVSHELRTPLAVIRSATELLLSQDNLDEKTRQRLLRIQRAQENGTDLTNALLQLSRNERGHGNTDVSRVAEHLLEANRLQLRGKPLELRLEGHPGLMVDAPEAAVNVALGNLIGNAVKYTASGAVVVRVNDTSVDVIDSGPGLSAEEAARLFERGYRGAHAEHTHGGGIGLSIVRRLCALYGWNVRVVPGEERGVIATLSFR